eukprot:scaffold112224_cov66-Phaeocystis_antarctica.AAC.6
MRRSSASHRSRSRALRERGGASPSALRCAEQVASLYLRALALHVEPAGVPLHVHELVEIDELIACSSSEW